MTANELLDHRRTKYLFTQNGYDFYECGYRFYKIKRGDEKAIPVDVKDDALSGMLPYDIDNSEVYDTKTGETVADVESYETLKILRPIDAIGSERL